MVEMSTGDRCVIYTPGGGGFGSPEAKLGQVIQSKVHYPRAAGSVSAYATAQAEAT